MIGDVWMDTRMGGLTGTDTKQQIRANVADRQAADDEWLGEYMGK